MANAPNRWWGNSTGLWVNVKRLAGAVIIYNVGSNIYQTYKVFKEYVTLPEAFYLDLDLEQQMLVERLSSNPVNLITSGFNQLELRSLIQALHTAKTDGRVRGIMAVLGARENFGGMAQLQELRNALLDFRFHAKGRAPVFAYSNTFGEGGMNATGLYYLASAADKVFMPPTSCLSLLGFESTQVFVRGLLDKFKIQPEVFRREEYKSAMSPLTDTAFDPAHKENITSLLQSLYDQVVEGIAAARRLTPQEVESAISAAPLLPSMAMQMNLLDGLMYRDQVEQLLLQQLPTHIQRAVQQARSASPSPRTRSPTAVQLAGPRVPLQRYVAATSWAKQSAELWGSSSSSSSGKGNRPGSHNSLPSAAMSSSSSSTDHISGDQHQQHQDITVVTPAASRSLQQQQQVFGNPKNRLQQPCVAVVTAAGPIAQTAAGGGQSPTNDGMIESHKLVRALRSIRENPQFKAVVLRINSPGGSAVASDIIAREITLLREAGKPVVACMADVAASGGYYIAAPATKILAQPGTITGSIGVISARIKAKEALEEFGITGDTVKLGDNANWASPFHTLTPKQQQQVESLIDSTYDSFLAQVAAGRSLSKEAVRQVAKGRVWSGAQALKVGLVDELGGVTRALELARELAGLPEDPDASLVLEWPPRRIPPWMMLAKSSSALPGSQDVEPAATGRSTMPSTQALAGVHPMFEDAAARITTAASMLGTFIRVAWHLGMNGVCFDACASTTHELEAAMAGSLQHHADWRRMQQVASQAVAAASRTTPSAVQAAAGVAGVLAVPGSVGFTGPSMAPQMMCLEAELLAYSC